MYAIAVNVAPCPNVTEDKDEHEEFIDEVSAIWQATREVSNHNTSGIEGKNSDEVLVVGITFMKNGDLLMDQLENIIEKEQVNPSQTSFQLASSPWLYNLIQVSIEVGQCVKLPTPYEVSDVYLESEYQRVRD
ncbi:hypothetical protein GOBAR_AA20404 [Gossypium barbadense]|uniref:Uncharacterized protein n=1 Tax=Gossypium barbadense TaxID=3634 RepID=A0A2P5XAA0_GOSBA|nr:hypothetical protein GOBAR_AA20404 [Gossypium barbadense]